METRQDYDQECEQEAEVEDEQGANEQISSEAAPDLMKMEEDLIIMAYGPIPNREPCVFFNYPSFLKIQRPYQDDQIVK